MKNKKGKSKEEAMFQKRIMIPLVILLLGFYIAYAEQYYYYVPEPIFDAHKYTDRLYVYFKEGVTIDEINAFILQPQYSDYKLGVVLVFAPTNSYILHFDEKEINVDVLKRLMETEFIFSKVWHSYWFQPIEYEPIKAPLYPKEPEENDHIPNE